MSGEDFCNGPFRHGAHLLAMARTGTAREGVADQKHRDCVPQDILRSPGTASQRECRPAWWVPGYGLFTVIEVPSVLPSTSWFSLATYVSPGIVTAVTV